MGTALAHNGKQPQSSDHFPRVFCVVIPQYEPVFVPLRKRGRNMDPPQDIREQTTIKQWIFGLNRSRKRTRCVSQTVKSWSPCVGMHAVQSTIQNWATFSPGQCKGTVSMAKILD